MEKQNKVLEFPSKELILEQAGAWVARMDEGKLSDDEVRELKQWAGQSELHLRSLRNAAKVWDRMEVMSGLSELLPLKKIPSEKQSCFRYAVSAAAISVIACIFIVASNFPFLPQVTNEQVVVNENRMTYKTQVGGSEVIELSDGSVVKLNTDTHVEVDITSAKRAIYLLGGEAYFEVARNESVPFVVTANGTQAEALGTAFGVQMLDDQIEVMVTEGLVRVKPSHTQESGDMASPFTPVILKAGQLIQVDNSGTPEIKDVDPDHIAHTLLWQQKMLAFDGETLKEVINEFSRYTNLKLVVADAKTADIRVGGYFRSDDISGLLTSLDENFNISVEQIGVDTFSLQKKTE